YNHSGLPGIYRLTNTGPVFHVVPAQSKGRSGALTDRHSLLDTAISIKPGDRTGLDMLREIVDAVSSSHGGVRVMLGSVPLNLLMQTPVQDGAQNEPARDVILHTFDATRRHLTWMLFCDPSRGDNHLCALNVRVVDAARPRSK